jgi:hypothetical protein
MKKVADSFLRNEKLPIFQVGKTVIEAGPDNKVGRPFLR